jgi:hypothetical protein
MKIIGIPILIEDEQTIISPSTVKIAYFAKPAGMESA